MLEVGPQVVDIFDAHAQPNQAVVDTAGRSDVGRDARVRHRRRMTDQRFHASQAFGQAEQPRASQKPLGGRVRRP